MWRLGATTIILVVQLIKYSSRTTNPQGESPWCEKFRLFSFHSLGSFALVVSQLWGPRSKTRHTQPTKSQIGCPQKSRQGAWRRGSPSGSAAQAASPGCDEAAGSRLQPGRAHPSHGPWDSSHTFHQLRTQPQFLHSPPLSSTLLHSPPLSSSFLQFPPVSSLWLVSHLFTGPQTPGFSAGLAWKAKRKKDSDEQKSAAPKVPGQGRQPALGFCKPHLDKKKLAWAMIQVASARVETTPSFLQIHGEGRGSSYSLPGLGHPRPGNISLISTKVRTCCAVMAKCLITVTHAPDPERNPTWGCPLLQTCLLVRDLLSLVAPSWGWANANPLV